MDPTHPGGAKLKLVTGSAGTGRRKKTSGSRLPGSRTRPRDPASSFPAGPWTPGGGCRYEPFGHQMGPQKAAKKQTADINTSKRVKSSMKEW